ncbi:MAG: Folylpolyglutamate synthase [Alphaproteobacteria bacterium MarineAlpha5_Bin9]|nr:MAG: Folylpolyglutamate synthase [Alphaproteobacteria bacterium MarineAlpha5_Bin9]|tara:strand:+ start:5485 stop:6753 length:1269 start_codon:yes stop_codon:yes gene_type:complete
MSERILKNLLSRFQKLHPKYIDLQLNRLIKLLNKIDNPHLKLSNVIHIAGTNGKGSTLSYIKEILIQNKYSVNCYISPHLEKFEERITLKNKIVSKKKLISALKYIEKINNKKPITFFEITTAAAFYLFNKNRADFLILETGLGGKYDATNVIQNPIINIITPIGLDHQEFLGSSLMKIVNEKLGIIKKKSSIIISKQNNNTMKYISKNIKNLKNNKIIYNKHYEIKKIQKNSFIFKHFNIDYKYSKPNLIGTHQIENASTALAACYELKRKKFKLSKIAINKGLVKTKWEGRLEKFIFDSIEYYFDGAHNPEGAIKLSNFMKISKIDTWLILGMMNNKDILTFLKILKENINGVICIKIPEQKNSYEPYEISKICDKLNIENKIIDSFNKANKYLINKIKPDRIIVTGSLYLVGKTRKYLL